MPAVDLQPLCPSLTPEEIVRDVTHLPSAPRVLPRLKELLCDDNSAMHEIAALIRLDPGIAARVLQTANSAYFSKGVRCFAVDEAVQRVGYGQVYELVSLAVAAQVLVRPLAVYGIESDELWKMSVACAIAAELLAERTGQERNVAYTVGLLHGVGMVAIDEWALRHERELTLRREGFPAEAIADERAVFGFTQAAVGAALLLDWGFPRPIYDPVRWQYSPRQAMSQAPMAGLLHIAKWLRTVACALQNPPPPVPADADLRACNLTAKSLAELATEVARRLHEVDSLLETKSVSVVGREKFPAQSWGG
jgi:HD-like signal output (HDOD) protein